MVDREHGRVIFNQVAGLYAEARPSYPDQLIDDILSLSGFPPGGRVLEVGCGAGQASRAFAARGGALLSLEPGPDLAAIARESLRAYPNAAVEVTTFEEWPLQAQAFDLVAFPSSLKWVHPAVRYTKSAAALKDSGSIAIFGNGARHPAASETRRELDALYAELAPELARPPRTEAPAGDGLTGDLLASGLFTGVVVRRYPWSRDYDAEGYLKLLNTYSEHIALPEEKRRRLFAAIADLIACHGGAITRSAVATLHLAKRSLAVPWTLPPRPCRFA